MLKKENLITREKLIALLDQNFGSIVYGISRNKIIPLIIEEIRYNKYGIELISTNEEYYGYGKVTLDPNNKIGMEWYKTKEEAKKHWRKSND